MDGDAATLVLDILIKATSQNGEILKSAEKQLHDLETEQGFYTVLMRIFSDKNVDANVRWQAILYIKNGVDRYWRKHSTGAINSEEKAKIKAMLLDNFHEPVNQLALQLAVVIGKVARFDCPKEWPELLPSLVDAITTVNDQLHQQRILMSFYQVIKCLSSKRLAHDRKVFEELTNSIFDFVLNLWSTQMSQFDTYLSQGNVQSAHMMLGYAHLTLKVLRKLVAYGLKVPKDNENARSFIQQCFFGITNMLEAGKSLPNLTTVGSIWNKMLIIYSKILLDMLLYHPEMYVDYISLSLELTCKLCFTGASSVVDLERFNVNLLNLMKDILNNDSYRPQTLNVGEASGGFALKAYQTVRSTMNSETLMGILRALVYRYLPLTTTELELWETCAEEYVNEEGGDSYKYSIRACVETLFATIFKEFKPIVTPMLLEMVREAESPCDPNNMDNLLKKDALYNAVGLAAYDIYDDVDFDSWLKNHLAGELSVSHPNYRVVKRRVIWLIGNWINVKLSVAARPILYDIILKLLGDSEDLVVRIETALTLKAAVDDFEFTYEQFAVYMEPSFHLLFKLLTDVESCDSKMKVLHVMSFLIERSGAHIAPHCQTLIQYLPLLWQESEEHHLLRSSIVCTLVFLVQGLGADSAQLHSIVLPVIQLSTDLKQDAHVYLLEDGLNLWQAMLYNSVVGNKDILQLFTAIPDLIDASTENLRICLKIIEAYTLLCGEELMSNYGNLLVDCICSLVTDIKPEGLISVLKTVEVFFKLFSRQASLMFKRLFISWIIPSILDGESYPMVMSLYLSIVSRVSFEDRNVLLAYIAEFCDVNAKQQMLVISDFLVMWFDKLDYISQRERKKMCALGISTLIPTSLGSTVTGLDPMVNACVQVMHDVCTKVTTDGALEIVDTVVVDPSELDKLSNCDLDDAHTRRKQELSFKDPVFHVHLDRFVWTKLKELCSHVGEEKFQSLMSGMDPDISSQLQDFMRHQT